MMQETFIKAFKNINRFRAVDQPSFNSWLNRIAVNHSIGQLRKNKRRKKDVEDPITTLQVEPRADLPSPEKETLINLTMAKIRAALDDLSPKQRIIFHMRHSQHLAIQDIANNLDCSQSSIKKHLYRAVAKLQKRLEYLLEEK